MPPASASSACRSTRRTSPGAIRTFAACTSPHRRRSTVSARACPDGRRCAPDRTLETLEGGLPMKARYIAQMLVAAAFAGGAFAASAQDYPARTVTIIVPFSPGGPGDLTARFVAQGLQNALGQSFVVEN